MQFSEFKSTHCTETSVQMQYKSLKCMTKIVVALIWNAFQQNTGRHIKDELWTHTNASKIIAKLQLLKA